MELAIIVPTVGRPQSVAALLPQICAQAPRRAEIRVVDQSDDADHAAVREACARLADPRVRVFRLGRHGLPAARNAGLAVTRAPVVLFLDDDVRLRPGCLAAHLACYRDPRVGGVVGRILEHRLRPNAWRTCNELGWGGRIRTRLDGADAVGVASLKGANMSLRRRALEQAGGFDPAFAGTALLEDADASERVRRAGWELRYDPDAAVEHLHVAQGGCRSEGAGWARTEWWRFHNTALYVRRHRGWPALLPVAATFGAIAGHRAVARVAPRTAVGFLGALAAGWSRGRR